MTKNKKNAQSCIIGLDGKLLLFDGSSVKTISDLKEIKSDSMYIADINESISRVTTVDAPYQYADVIIRKKVQESGEFNDTVTILPHLKKKRAAKTTEFFFTAVPSAIYNTINETIDENPYNIIFYPLYAVLFSILKQQVASEPSALVFFHDRFADILIARKNRVYYAARNVAFNTSSEQIQTIWDTILSDLDAEAERHRIDISTIYILDWIDFKPQNPESAEPDEQLHTESNTDFDTYIRESVNNRDYEIEKLPAQRLLYNGRETTTAFTPQLEKLKLSDSISPLATKLSWTASKFSATFNGLMLIVLMLMFSGVVTYHMKNNQVLKQIESLEKKIAATRAELPVAEKIENFDTIFSFVKKIDRISKTPSFRHIINDFSSAGFEELRLTSVKIDYVDNEIRIEAYGTIEAPFNRAHKGYKHFLSVLKNRDFRITENRFDTDISDSNFLIKLIKTIN